MEDGHLASERAVECADGGVYLCVDLEVGHGPRPAAGRADGGRRDLTPHRLRRGRLLLGGTQLHHVQLVIYDMIIASTSIVT